MKIAEASVAALPQKETLNPHNPRPVATASRRITDHDYPALASEVVARLKFQAFARLLVDTWVGLHAAQPIAIPVRSDSWEKLLNDWPVWTRKI